MTKERSGLHHSIQAAKFETPQITSRGRVRKNSKEKYRDNLKLFETSLQNQLPHEAGLLSQIIIMGDSLSDRGTMNKRRLFKVIPMDGLAGLRGKSPTGRFTNGYAWSDYVCAMLANGFDVLGYHQIEQEKSNKLKQFIMTEILAKQQGPVSQNDKEQLNEEEEKRMAAARRRLAIDISDSFISNESKIKEKFGHYSLDNDRTVKYNGQPFVRSYNEGGLTSHNWAGQFTWSPSRFFSRFILSKLANKEREVLNYDNDYGVLEDKKAETLIIEWSGANDLITVNKRPSKEAANLAIQDRKNNVADLHAHGYRHFVLFNLPDLSLTPRFFSDFAKLQCYLEEEIAAIPGKLENLRSQLLDITKELERLESDSAQYLPGDVAHKDALERDKTAILKQEKFLTAELPRLIKQAKENAKKLRNKGALEKAALENSNAREVSNYFNTKLQAACQDLQDQFRDSHIEVFDVASQFSEIYKNPEKFGFNRFKRSIAYRNSDEFKLDKKSKTSPSTGMMFWDDVHPTSDLHDRLAEFFYNWLNNNFRFTPPKIDIPEKELLENFRKAYRTKFLKDKSGFFGHWRRSNFSNVDSANLHDILRHASGTGKRSREVIQKLGWIDAEGKLNPNISALREAARGTAYELAEAYPEKLPSPISRNLGKLCIDKDGKVGFMDGEPETNTGESSPGMTMGS